MALQKPVHPSAEALKQGYEPEGIDFWTLVGSMVVLGLVIALFMGVATWWILATTRHERDAEKPPSFVPAAVVNSALPPLQPQPSHNRTAAQDDALFNQHVAEVFDSIGWHVQGPENKPHVPDEVISIVAAKHGAGH